MITKDIVFIHGAWVTPLCWEHFQPFFEERGYRTQAPPWPGKDPSIEEQRAIPSSQLLALGVKQIVNQYASIIEASPTPPILVGHSFGGLFVQLLLARGLGAAGVAIDSAPPRGVFTFYPSVLRSLGRVLLSPKGWDRILHLPFSNFSYSFVNTFSPEDQRAAYDRYVVPETGRPFFQAAVSLVNPWSPTKVDFGKTPRAPLLLVAGGSDHIVPAAVNRSNYRKYRKSAATTAFKEFPGRSHLVIAQAGWQEVAGFIADWLDALPQEGEPGAA